MAQLLDSDDALIVTQIDGTEINPLQSAFDQINQNFVELSGGSLGGVSEILNQNPGALNIKMWTGNQAEYDALTPEVSTLYFITEGDSAGGVINDSDSAGGGTDSDSATPPQPATFEYSTTSPQFYWVERTAVYGIYTFRVYQAYWDGTQYIPDTDLFVPEGTDWPTSFVDGPVTYTRGEFVEQQNPSSQIVERLYKVSKEGDYPTESQGAGGGSDDEFIDYSLK
jgi:hypothetical protein